MAVRTKQIFAKPSEEDGIRFLITRYHPRGVKSDHYDQWIRELSPSPKLLFDLKEERISWETFKQRFLVEMASSIPSLEVINILHNEMKTDTITLLCFERSGVPCHRHIVKEVIENPKILQAYA